MSYQADQGASTREAIKGQKCPDGVIPHDPDGVIPHDPNVLHVAFLKGAATGALGVVLGSVIGLVLVGLARKLL